jgi:signal transduction histidine kinase
VVPEADDHGCRSAYIQPVSLPTRLIERARRLDARVVDGALAMALTAWALAWPRALSSPGEAVVLVAMTVAIAWRRRAPVGVVLVEVAGVVLLPKSLGWPEGVAVLIAAYSAALHSDSRGLVLALLLFAAAWLLAFGGGATIPRGLVPFLLLAPAWLAGNAMRVHELRVEASAARANRLEHERDAAVAAERARIARELHDVVTHSVSVMVLQTGAAREIMTKDESRSRALLESVEASGRQALEELRRMLGLLSGDDGDAPLAPQPDLTQIPFLIDQVRQTGADVELCVEGAPREVSGGAAVAAYRIVQEALTNVLKHADGAPSRVVLRWARGALELEIVDDGPPHDDAAADIPAGRGVAGMRDRAAMYGGTFEAHPGPDHGYVVRARIPLETGGM